VGRVNVKPLALLWPNKRAASPACGSWVAPSPFETMTNQLGTSRGSEPSPLIAAAVVAFPQAEAHSSSPEEVCGWNPRFIVQWWMTVTTTGGSNHGDVHADGEVLGPRLEGDH